VDFVAVLDQVIALLRQRGRITYRTLQRQFQLDEAALEDLKEELLYGQCLAVDDDSRVLVWTGATGSSAPAAAVSLETAAPPPLTYTPSYLAEKIVMARRTLEGERKQVTGLFADLKGSMELLADRDPEEARQLLDPVLERMMAAVHRYALRLLGESAARRDPPDVEPAVSHYRQALTLAEELGMCPLQAPVTVASVCSMAGSANGSRRVPYGV
jgi:hypothetical protein